MNNKDMQHWLDRNRPPRVQITYDVETLGATVKEEIPFIVGVIGDFAGSTQQKAIAERTFVEIDRDSFEQVMQRLGPTLTLDSKPQLQPSRAPTGTTYAPDPNNPKVFPVSLAFQKMKDFEPPAIIGQVDYLQGFLQTRQSLSDLMAKLGTDPSVEADLKTAAAAPALASAVTALTTANKGLTADTTGTLALFDKAAGDVLNLETADPNNSAVKNAQAAVAKVVGDDNGGYTKAFTAATAANAPAAAVKAAADALQGVVAALQAGILVLAGITSGYDRTAGTDPQKAAITDVKNASDNVNAFVPVAWQASLCGNSALVVSPPAP